MITEMYMPKNGMDMTEGTIIRWLKEVGEHVEADEPIMEIETDKIVMEAEAPGSGTLLKKLYQEGETVPVLTVIGYIGEAGDAIPEQGVKEAKTEKSVVLEATADSKSGEGKVCESIAATPAARQLAAEKEIPLSTVSAGGSEGQILRRDVEKAANSTGVARALAEEEKLKLNQIKGSGEGGRVTREDVVAARTASESKTPESRTVKVSCVRKPLSGMRRVIAKRMLESHTNIPTVTQNTPVDVTRLMALRREMNEERGSKISVNDFILKAVAIATAESERIRMQFSTSEYSLLEQVNVGVAVSTSDGLLVPVIRDADRKSLVQISAEAKQLAIKARENRLKPDELGDARITVTNLGMYGVHSFTPIINEPECAILGVCAAEDYLVLNSQNQVEGRKRMMLCLTYDHRILNGTEAAEFSNKVRDLLEHPFRLLS